MLPPGMAHMAKDFAKSALSDALNNPATQEALQAAGDRLVTVQSAVVGGRPPSAMHYYAWGVGLGTVSVVNLYAAYRLPAEDKLLKAYMVLSGLAAGAGAYVNFSRARR
jgi:hypothetical protein